VGLLAFAWAPAVWLVAVAVLAIPVPVFLDYLALRRTCNAISVRRELPVCAGRGSPFRVALHLACSVGRDVVGELRDCLPVSADPAYWHERFELSPGKEREFACQVRIPTRGLHAFGPVWVRVRGATGMLESQRSYDCPGEVKVLPDGAGSREAIRKDALAEQRILDEMTRARLRGEGLEFESISEYRAGDDPRRIDWRSSARQRRLMVRRYQLERHRDVVILLDCGRLMVASAASASPGTRPLPHGPGQEAGQPAPPPRSVRGQVAAPPLRGGGAGARLKAGEPTKLDCAVDSALMLCRVALEKGDRCGLGIFDDQVLGFLPPLSGPGAYRVLLESVYDIRSRWRETDFSPMFATLQRRHPKRSLVVVLSDAVDADTSVRFRSALVALARKHVLVFAAIQTPLMRELVAEPIGSSLDVSRKAVTFRLLREREKALRSLELSGVHILDVEPGRLTVPLVNRYIELRERNLV
jgi:uncharacterized protein (DUF58 family)